MGFRVNHNTIALDANRYIEKFNKKFSNSLSNLSSGLRIKSAEDDPGSYAIANSIRLQAKSLNQAVKNTNDGIGIIKIADYAMQEQVKILELIKSKAIQAAQDGQTKKSRRALQDDISKLVEELDLIANSTSFNNIKLLNGNFINKEFHIGSYTKETSKTSIPPTMSTHIGHTRFETGTLISSSSRVDMSFYNVSGNKKVLLEPAYISYSGGTGIGVLAEIINSNSQELGGVRAKWSVLSTGNRSITAGNIQTLRINGIVIGNIDVKNNDSDGVLLANINEKKAETGVEAYINESGHINLRSIDGRGIVISSANNSIDTIMHISARSQENYGRLTLIKNNSSDIVVSSAGNSGFQTENLVSQDTITLDQGLKQLTIQQADASGYFANYAELSAATRFNSLVEVGVTTLEGAMNIIAIAKSALDRLGSIRSELGAVQQELSYTVKNIQNIALNLKSSESYIRDIDFATESTEFNKFKILAQMGSYALSQSNISEEQALKLLQ